MTTTDTMTDPFDDANISRKPTDWPAPNAAVNGSSATPGEYVDYFDDPFAVLEQLQNRWRSKDRRGETAWSAENLPDVDLTDVDWHRYEPPASLSKTPNVTCQILLDIVASSIDVVRERNASEDRQRQDDEDRRKVAEEEAAHRARHGSDYSEPYLPIIIRPEHPALQTTVAHTRSVDSAIGMPPPPPSSSPPPAPLRRAPSVASAAFAAKVEKRRGFALKRLFHRKAGDGESSAGGGAREALRQQLEAALGRLDVASTDSHTQRTLQKLRKSGFYDGLGVAAEVECVSCLDDVPQRDCVKLVCHSYCRECFVRLITAAVQNEQQWPPKCCLNQIPFRTVLKHIPDGLKKTFQQRASEWEVPVSERVYCHRPDCALWVQPRNITMAKRQGRCERGHLTCTTCRGRHHGTGECPEDRDMDLTNVLAEEEGWKRCSSCNALVEHREACQHMTCRCGHQFCYVCGQRWRTCSCTMDALHALKGAAQERREHRLFREQTEAAELRQILAQIEMFEQEQARRAELERQEQARLAEERWQRQIKERIRQETVRRREVELKYEEARHGLDELHELQRVMANTQQEEEARDLVKDSEAKRAELDIQQQEQRASVETLVQSRMAAKEKAFAREYALRAAQERKMEGEYEEQLQAFWIGKPDAAAKVEAAMRPLRRRMDKGLRLWQQWRDEELAQYRTRLEDERTIREELMYSARHRLAARLEDVGEEARRRAAAERKWLREVVLERERMLGAREVEEMEGDADSLFALDEEAPEGGVGAAAASGSGS
ncbi:hypothetical protein JDV02_001686 [Purpureocillium takamizusanense]|uniref:RBR-type E3 ubiquitin transferase n=1 Tax=Purpureocillium takamizusanense TaxID=2060973 RepID=A0A9Q8Q8Q7_9HYPO|nr:uncharacterized protein JDV02_001686 [Purpureocillium takamizusanense]UNI15120.1 hypothetical protein JDV02_001686 [Purpureocillium takamizusanense]